MDISPDVLHRHLQDDLTDAVTKDLEVLPPSLDTVVRVYACENLKRTLLKKLEPKETSAADLAALNKWLEKNLEAAEWAWRPTCQRDEVLLNEVKAIIDSYFFAGPDMFLTLGEIAAGFDQGPGASVGAKHDDFYTKFFNSPLTHTSSSLHALYMEAIRANPTWFSAESNRSDYSGSRIVEGSKLTFARKYADISRVICVEPTLNMAFQKGISTVLKRCLKRRTGIDMSLQPDKNRLLARLGSESGSFGTIDLESASDSISMGLVDELFPNHVKMWLKKARSPMAVLPDGKPIELHMISSMGNDYTFPLQTMIFSAVVLAVYKVKGIKPSNPRSAKVVTGRMNIQAGKLTMTSDLLSDEFRYVGKERLGNWGVFGDDIICRREAYDDVVHLLTLLGFTVNEQKSFNTGPFRESCGTDWLYGQNVRGVYLKTVDTEQDAYSAINRLNRWAARHMVRLPRTLAYLLEQVEFLPVPLEEQDESGIRLPYEVVALGRSTRKNGTGRTLYRYWSVRSKSYDLFDPESAARLEGHRENPNGLLVAALAGRLHDGRVTPRLRSKSSRCKVGSSFRWNWFPTARAERPEFHASFVHLAWVHFAAASYEAKPFRPVEKRRKRNSLQSRNLTKS